MNAPSDHLPRHKDDFGRVYDLEDPSPCFNALRPSEYRMPAALAGALKAIHRAVCAARGAGDALRVLDFACGYGAIGALLRHDVSMPEIYARYGERHWRTADARSHWEADADFFAARREESVAFEIGGTDIAGVALEYAAALGFVDRTFHEDLVGDAPSEELRQFLGGVTLASQADSSTERKVVYPPSVERKLRIIWIFTVGLVQTRSLEIRFIRVSTSLGVQDSV